MRAGRVSLSFSPSLSHSGKEYRYGESVLNFPVSNEAIKLSNFVQNYAKIENAFSIDLSGK